LISGGSKAEALSHPPTEIRDRANSETNYGDEKVSLKLLTKSRQEQHMRIKNTDPLSKLFTKYREIAVSKGWASHGSKMKFVFDGEEIHANDTAASLDMENGVVIDVHIA
jgi:Ubiquitin-2 like Rad60 SUMO-like